MKPKVAAFLFIALSFAVGGILSPIGDEPEQLQTVCQEWKTSTGGGWFCEHKPG